MALLILTSAFATGSVLLVVIGLALLLNDKTVSQRLDMYLAGTSTESITLQEWELSKPFSERVIVPLIKRLARVFSWMWPQNRISLLRTRLTMAGDPAGISAGDFVGVKGLVMVLTVGVALLFGFLTGYRLNYFSMLLLILLGLCGFFLPDIWLSRRIRQRQQGLIDTLPDALDMLIIAIEAGLSFENAMQEIAGKWTNELSREFKRVLRDIGMGQNRRQALAGLSERTGVPDIISFVTALNQAEELGISIGRVLSIQAEELRVKRRQRAQEKANQAPIKMMFPLVFLIFPAIFAVLLGPAVPQLLRSFNSAGGGK
jgi:tight adherence protein C